MENERNNILIVDDHPIFRNGLKNILRKTNYFEKIYEAPDGVCALDLIKNEVIDMVMMDIEMPNMNGVDATYEILKFKPEIKVIALTMFSEPKLIYNIHKNGAKGYLLKDSDPKEIGKAISMLLNNEEYYSPRIQGILVKVYRDYDQYLPKFNPDLKISQSQINVLKLLCEQKSSEEIAEILHLSLHTVKRHRHDLLERTESINLAGLVIYAIEHHIIEINKLP